MDCAGMGPLGSVVLGTRSIVEYVLANLVTCYFFTVHVAQLAMATVVAHGILWYRVYFCRMLWGLRVLRCRSVFGPQVLRRRAVADEDMIRSTDI